MKKVLFAFIFIASFLSCADDFNQDINQNLSEANKVLKQAADGKHDLLGFSYDITKEYLHVDAAPRSVLDMDAFKRDNSGRYYEPASTLGGIDIYAGSNAIEMIEEIKTKTKASAAVAGPGLGSLKIFVASAKMEKEKDEKKTYFSKDSYARGEVVKRIKRLYLDADTKLLLKYVRPEFYDNLKRLSADNFVKEYGTHVLTDITIGGRLSFIYQSNITEESSNIRKKEIAEAGLKFNIGKFGADVDMSHEKEEIKSLSTKNAFWKTSVVYHGGEESGTVLNYDSDKGIYNSNFSISTWEKSVTSTNAALVNVNWEKAIPIYEFITDPAKKEEVRLAVIKYIQNSQITLVETKPMYEMYSVGFKSYYYLFDWADVVYNKARWGDHYREVVGYVLVNNEAGKTKPMYQMFSVGYKSYYYLYNWNDVVYHQQRWGDLYEGLKAYALINNEEKAVPLYKMFSYGLESYFYLYDWETVRQRQGQWGDLYERIDAYIYKK